MGSNNNGSNSLQNDRKKELKAYVKAVRAWVKELDKYVANIGDSSNPPPPPPPPPGPR